MKYLLVVAIAWTQTSVPCSGQEAGSVEAYRRWIEIERRNSRELLAWQHAKKLTFLDKIPDTPRDQSECLYTSELRDGAVGYLEYWHTEVIQILGPNKALLMIGNPSKPALLLKGYPTKDLVDGDEVRLVGMVKIDGTESYTSITGAKKTVRIVLLLSKEQIRKMEADAEAAAEAALFRTWADDTGKHQIVAKFESFKKGNVYLKRKDNGRTIDLPLSKISKKDRRWIRNELKKRREIEVKSKKNKAVVR